MRHAGRRRVDAIPQHHVAGSDGETAEGFAALAHAGQLEEVAFQAGQIEGVMHLPVGSGGAGLGHGGGVDGVQRAAQRGQLPVGVLAHLLRQPAQPSFGGPQPFEHADGGDLGQSGGGSARGGLGQGTAAGQVDQQQPQDGLRLLDVARPPHCSQRFGLLLPTVGEERAQDVPVLQVGQIGVLGLHPASIRRTRG